MPKTPKTGSLAPVAVAEIPIVGTDAISSGFNGKPHAWQPGESGNPAGRPKTLLTTAIRNAVTPEIASQLADVAIQRALKADFRWYELVISRLDGQPVKRSEIGEPGSFDTVIERLETDTLLAMVTELGRRHAVSQPNAATPPRSDDNDTSNGTSPPSQPSAPVG